MAPPREDQLCRFISVAFCLYGNGSGNVFLLNLFNGLYARVPVLRCSGIGLPSTRKNPSQSTSSSCVHCGEICVVTEHKSITSFSSTRRLLVGLERRARSARASNRNARVRSRRDL